MMGNDEGLAPPGTEVDDLLLPLSGDGYDSLDEEIGETTMARRSWWGIWQYTIEATVRRVLLIALVWFGIYSLLWVAHGWWH